MTQNQAQSLEIAAIGVLFVLHIARLSRLQRISFRYTVGWLSLCAISLFAGILVPVFSPLADFLQVDSFALVASAAIAVLLAICIQLSISISSLQQGQQILNEDLALSKLEIEKLRANKT